MKQCQVEAMLEEMGILWAYHHFEEEEAPNPPFLVYLYPKSDNFAADGINYQGISELDIELYTDAKEREIEKKVEAVLKQHGIFYVKQETYIESERLYEVLYEMEVLIDE